MFATVAQFTKLTPGKNPWGGVGCGVDSGEMGKCKMYVEDHTSVAAEVMTPCPLPLARKLSKLVAALSAAHDLRGLIRHHARVY